ncbi:MAG: hypothetical protein GX833_01735 [Clostridium sp.]|nr:hypothetical protein [Clostridium sp.]
MKKIKLFILFSFLAVVLIGCEMGSGKTNQNLSKKEVIEKARDSIKGLNSLNQVTNINLVTTLDDREENQNIELESKMIFDDQQNIESIYTSNVTTKNNLVQTFDFYKGSDGIFANQGTGWETYNGGENYATTYKPILDTFLDVVDDLEMTELDSDYEFKFTGKNGNIFRAVGKPYSINYNGITDDDIDLDIVYIIEKETMLLRQSKVGTKGSLSESNTATINAETTFKDFNTFETIENPANP